MSRRTIACAVLIVAATGLTACGKTGQLQRPGPLFGHPRTAPASDNPHQQDPTRPMQTIDPRDHNIDPLPARSDPIAGQSPDPMQSTPKGTLPDPYAQPSMAQ